MQSGKQDYDVNAPIDFEEWSQLASRDPDAFEKRRQAFIERFIEQYPTAKQRRLRGLQFRIDMERRRARTPMGACVRLSNMMWESFAGPEGLRAALNMLAGNTPVSKDTFYKPKRRARVIPIASAGNKH